MTSTELPVAYMLHTPYTQLDGTPIKLTFACGKNVTVNAIIGNPFLRAVDAVLDYGRHTMRIASWDETFELTYQPPKVTKSSEMNYPGKLHYLSSAYSLCAEVVGILEHFHPSSDCLPAATALVTSFASHVSSRPDVDFYYPVTAPTSILKKAVCFSEDTEDGNFDPSSRPTLDRAAAVKGASITPTAPMLDLRGSGPGPGHASQQAPSIAFGDRSMQLVGNAPTGNMRHGPGALQDPSGLDGESSDDNASIFSRDDYGVSYAEMSHGYSMLMNVTELGSQP